MSLIFKWIHRCTIGVLLLVFQNVICFRFKKSIVHHIPQTFPLQQARGFGIPICELPKVRSRCGKISPRREIPSHIKVPDYAYDGIPKGKEAIQVVPTRQCDIEKMRLTCKYAREVLDAAIWAVYKGIAKTTDDIDRIVHEECIKRNSYPSPLNYKGFPKSCCTSINEIMCHGIPDSTPLIDGDILNIDVTLFHDGVHGDCSETILVGNKTSVAIKQLIKTTFVAWQTAIRQCRPGVLYSSIGDTIESIIQPAGYSVGRDFAGHGINSVFHGPPTVLHFRNKKSSSTAMAAGHTFTIEPIVCMGDSSPIFWKDGWTVSTKDNSPCAQFEHTILITENGAECLTAKTESSPKYFWET